MQAKGVTMSIQLRQHQSEAVRIARTRKRFCFFWKPGTGKTIGILGIQKYRPMRTLVVAQKSIFYTAWIKDAKAMGIPCFIVWGKNKANRVRAIMKTPGDVIIVTNYEQFRTNKELLLDSGVRRVVFDESSKLKNYQSKTSIAATWFADRVEEVYLLSGTPRPNCPTELWSQLRVTSPRAVGGNFYRWAYHWFNETKKMVPITTKCRRTGQLKTEMKARHNEWNHK
jgi:hypothetical protein